MRTFTKFAIYLLVVALHYNVGFADSEAKPTAALQLEYYTKSFKVLNGEEVIKFDLPFSVTENGGIEITNIETSCGCTATDLAKKTFEFGEKSHVSGSISTKEKSGFSTISIIIHGRSLSNPGKSFKETAKLSLYVEPIFIVSKNVLFWKKGAQPLEQKINVSFSKPMRIQEMTESPNRFSVKINTIKTESEYEISVRPTTTINDQSHEVISVIGIDREGRQHFQRIHFLVR